MDLSYAIKYLEYYNGWRRGGVGDMPNPKELGLVIDFVIDELKGLDDEGR